MTSCISRPGVRSETDENNDMNIFPNPSVVNYLIYCGYDIHQR